MVAVQSRPAIDITTDEERAIFDALFYRGALAPGQVAAEVRVDEFAVEIWLAGKAGQRVIDFDPRFGRYATFE